MNKKYTLAFDKLSNVTLFLQWKYTICVYPYLKFHFYFRIVEKIITE